MNIRSFAVDVGRTALLAAALVASLAATDYLSHGALARPFGMALLFSCGSLAFFSLLERAVPAGGARKSRTQWLLNLRIGIGYFTHAGPRFQGMSVQRVL